MYQLTFWYRSIIVWTQVWLVCQCQKYGTCSSNESDTSAGPFTLATDSQINDCGSDSTGDSLIYYCCDGVPRYCLSNENHCYWKDYGCNNTAYYAAYNCQPVSGCSWKNEMAHSSSLGIYWWCNTQNQTFCATTVGSDSSCNYTFSVPTVNPTNIPTNIPTSIPTQNPSQNPSQNPTQYPSNNPTDAPIRYPTFSPSLSPSDAPLTNPTSSPSYEPTTGPTMSPTATPTTSKQSKSVFSDFGTIPGVIIIILSVSLVILCFVACWLVKSKKKGNDDGTAVMVDGNNTNSTRQPLMDSTTAQQIEQNIEQEQEQKQDMDASLHSSLELETAKSGLSAKVVNVANIININNFKSNKSKTNLDKENNANESYQQLNELQTTNKNDNHNNSNGSDTTGSSLQHGGQLDRLFTG